MPKESPLPMPRGDLNQSAPPATATPIKLKEDPRIWGVRLTLAIFTMLGSAYGVWEMNGVISAASSTPLQWLFLGLFALNFTWIVYALGQALLGCVRIFSLPFIAPPARAGPLLMQTAVLVPVYNEDPQRVALAISAIATELAREAPESFDIFILSDTTDAAAWVREEKAFCDAIDRAPIGCRIFYRHRNVNSERKAGNIAQWVSRWGGAYGAMTVLDADSVMSAQSLVAMTRRLEASPDVALIQSIPSIIFSKTPFARIQQFANRCYGPIYANGLAAWHGKSSNFWGHNAVIRVEAFAKNGRLPVLQGSPPFGGHILSHDFAEAAFLRRAGWGVRLDADLEESYEQSPPSLLDVLIRDRRWCQGNLQHAKLLFAKGMHPCSRLHFATGILSYLTAPIWFMLILVGLFLAAQVVLSQPEYFAKPSLFPTWPVFDSERAVRLFIVSMAVVLAPKFLGWLTVMLSWRTLRNFGGPLLLTTNVLIEALFSALYAPIMMISQTGIVLSILAGRDAGWQPQRRADGHIPLAEILRAHLWHTLVGIGISALALWISIPLFFWLMPISVGLVLSIPLSWLSGQRAFESIFRRTQFLRTPEDNNPPPVLRHIALAVESAGSESSDATAQCHPLESFARDPKLAAWHAAQLEDTTCNAPQATHDDLLLALAKAERVSDPRSLGQWLTADQTMALISDLEYFRKTFGIARLNPSGMEN